MIELPSRYNPHDVEDKWLKEWDENNAFHAQPHSDKKPFTIVIPPPNVTGILHMGHALNNTLQDIMIRMKRMQGFETCWMPGTDHAGIATQNVVEKQLAKEGKKRADLGREKFIAKTWEWKQQYGDTIIHQLKKIGASCDWPRTRFTMDPNYSAAVTYVFFELFKKGLIYQGHRIINWCTRCQTALSDEEAEHKELPGNLYHIRYPLKSDLTKFIIVATTRPETMLGDTAVAVNPKDKRYKKLIGQIILLPLVNREISIISDEFVDPKFGTGCVKVTPSHDPNDFAMGKRHNLQFINIMHPDGKLNDNAGRFAGQDRFAGRKAVIEALQAEGLLEKIEPHQHAVGHCYRCNTIVEPYLSKQWFVKMAPLAKPAAEAVRKGKIKFYPNRWKKVYLNWMDNIQDWCISRQIWWGHSIPVWHKRINLTEENWTKELLGWGWDSYLKGNWKNDNIVVRILNAQTGQEVDPQKDPLMPVSHDTVGEYDIYICCLDGKSFEQAGFKQDPDVLDTWFSSWLWPFATFNWPQKNNDLNYFYPSATLLTAAEIIFFWVARMIMAGYEFMGEPPFKEVFIHGTVRDAQGRKMSKSLGNSIDPLEIIKEYGTDALRFSLIMNSGMDLYISKEKFEIGRNFANKIWNASRLVLLNCDLKNLAHKPLNKKDIKDLDIFSRWIVSRFHSTLQQVTKAIETYRFSEAETLIYDFFWKNFCDWYLEIRKDSFTKPENQMIALYILEQSTKLMHPFMPFVTEELFHVLNPQQASVSRATWPEFKKELLDHKTEVMMSHLMDVVTAIRNLRSQWNINPGEEISLTLSTTNQADFNFLNDTKLVIAKLVKANNITFADKIERTTESATSIIGQTKIVLPLKGIIDLEKEKQRLETTLKEQTTARENLSKRLQNKEFLNKAPADIISKEQSRMEAFSLKIRELESLLKNLN